jgi:hypothetical protein
MAAATAVAEIVGGIFVLIPRLAVYGGSLIAIVMLGATGTHIVAAEYSQIVVTVTFGAMAAFVAWYRCPWGKTEPE